MTYNVISIMEATNQSTHDNDYPVAKVFNSVLLSIVALVREAEEMDLPEDYEIDELNRAYVLIVHELDCLYSQNPKLFEIKPEPFWKRFDVIKTVSWRLLDYIDESDQDKGQAHMLKLDKLSIIAGSEIPELSSDQIELIGYASETVKKYRQKLDDARLDLNGRIEDSWYISEYRLEYKDGTILINDVLKLKKTHIGSTIDQLLEQAVKTPNKIFIPTLPQTARNLSTLLSSAGITPTLRQLFFPVVSKGKGVLFRPTVSFKQATRDKIDTTELDMLLKLLDSEISFSG